MIPAIKSKVLNKTQRGFTLIELMISMVIGLIILAAVIGMFVSMVKADNDYLKSVRLNQELRSVMSLITRDLRRSGYNGLAATHVIAGTANPFELMATTATSVNFAYDVNNDGINDCDSERFGFRLNSGAIQSGGYTSSCVATWQNITDENLVEITAFSVSDPDLVGDDPEETVTPGKTSAGITTHQITIELTGQLVRDTSVRRTIAETVEIRNDEY
ncbi:prepilin-type N-terminal cleavage/methylation domain-containing protein [Methylobacter svalbardensis]|uniref:prepilin-type N-terminal cleavage/methylation domain-containing protein n=1 Tax=Methylobacter svalbardensis TaxID=3080016 RepID=UPI0030EEAECC